MRKIHNALFLLIIFLHPGVGGKAWALDLDFRRVLDAASDLIGAGTGFSEKEEIDVGREIAGRTLGAAPLVSDTGLQAYVNRVGRWLAAQSERPDLPWHFGVIDTSAINAFAAPGGYVLITRGLYEMLDNEAQLAGVLGHEIAHVIKRHHVIVMQKSAAISAGARLAQSDRRSQLLNNMIGTGAEIFARGLDKSAEYEADAVGVVLAARAGYSPYGLVEVLHKLSARSAGDATLALLFKTHPQPGERLAQLADVLTPRMAALPEGREPGIRNIAATAGPNPGVQPSTAGGARTLQEQDKPAPPARSPGIDPGQILRGIFGR